MVAEGHYNKGRIGGLSAQRKSYVEFVLTPNALSRTNAISPGHLSMYEYRGPQT